MVGEKLHYATIPLHRKDANNPSDKNLGLCKPVLDLRYIILAARYRNGEEVCQHPERTEQRHTF